jgi:3-hydroxyacyl-CoA dehydrogenase
MSTRPKPSERIAIIGLGSIGAAWAIVFAAAGFRVHLQDTIGAWVAAERRPLLPLAGWEERVAWRDRALMALLRCRPGEAALEELGS